MTAKALTVHAVLALLLGALFAFWIAEGMAIEKAHSCPDTCLTYVKGEVTDVERVTVHSGRDSHESGRYRQSTIRLDTGREIDVDMGFDTGDDVEVGLWFRTPVRVTWYDWPSGDGAAWLHDGWPRTPAKFWLVPPLFAILVFALFAVAGEGAARWRRDPGPAGRLPLLPAGFALVLAVFANFAIAIADRFPAWWPVPAVLLLAALSRTKRARRAADAYRARRGDTPVTPPD
jgi:hypothetical protein